MVEPSTSLSNQQRGIQKQTDIADPDERKTEQTAKNDDSLDKKDAPSDKEITEHKTEQTTKNDDEEAPTKKDAANDKDITERKTEQTMSPTTQSSEETAKNAANDKDIGTKDRTNHKAQRRRAPREKRLEVTDAKKETSERKQDESLKSDDRASDFKLDDSQTGHIQSR